MSPAGDNNHLYFLITGHSIDNYHSRNQRLKRTTPRSAIVRKQDRLEVCCSAFMTQVCRGLRLETLARNSISAIQWISNENQQAITFNVCNIRNASNKLLDKIPLAISRTKFRILSVHVIDNSGYKFFRSRPQPLRTAILGRRHSSGHTRKILLKFFIPNRVSNGQHFPVSNHGRPNLGTIEKVTKLWNSCL